MTCESGFQRTHTRPTHERLLGALDLLRGHGIHNGAAALLDPTAYSNRTPLQPFRVDARRGEFSPMTLKNRYRKVACPASPKVQIYCGAAFPHRQDLALNQCKLALCGGNSGKIFRRKGAKLGSAQRPRRAARATRSERNRISAQTLSPILAATRAWPCSTSISCIDCWRSPT